MFKSFRIKNGTATHTDMTGGSFNVPSDKTNKFHTELARYIVAKKPLHIVETHNGIEFAPVTIDIDLDFDIKSNLKKTKLDTEKLKQIYVLLVRKMFKHLDSPETVKFHGYVLVKPEPYVDIEKDRIRDGVHIIFPNISTNCKYQDFLRKETIAELEKILDGIGHINSIEEVYDPIIIRSQFVMYGNHKKDQTPYLLKHIFCYNPKTKKVLDYLDQFNTKYPDITERTIHLLNTLSLRNKNDTPSKLKNNEIEEKKSITVKVSNEPILNVGNFEVQEAVGLVGLLKPTRADNYDDWIKIGWCLHNINECVELLNAWVDFSKKSKKFKVGECEKIWAKSSDEGYNIWSLRKWAEEDSPEKYEKFFKDNTNNIISKSISGTHNDVANLLYQLYKDVYICSINDKGAPIWFKFRRHRWAFCKKGLDLRKKISTDLVDIYDSKIQKLKEQANKSDIEPEHKKDLEKNYNHLYKICRDLKDSNFKGRVMKECAEFFQNDRFVEKLDANTNLLGFENGVYDAIEMKFRDGLPSDYISMSTGYDYNPLAKSEGLVNFIKSVMPVKEVRDYLLTLFSLTLFGCNFEQIFPILSGVGSNGKSSLIDLLRRVLGDYFAVLSVSALTSNRPESNACTPELARLKGKRCVVMNEPKKGVGMNLGKMKEWTGRDIIQARALYSDPIEFMLTCIFFLICNDLPEVNSMDQGTWRRLRNIHFPSRFIEKPNPNHENEYPINTKLSENFDEWAPAFTNILLNYYQNYKKNGLKTPDQVTALTEQYKLESDFMQEFANECLCKGKEADFVTFKDINVSFLSWFKENYPGKQSLASKELKTFLKQHYFRSESVSHKRRIGWFGYKLVNVEENDAPDDLDA